MLRSYTSSSGICWSYSSGSNDYVASIDCKAHDRSGDAVKG